MLETRSTEQEIMDDLSISGEVVDQTLRELNTINRRLGGNRISKNAFKKLVNKKDELSVADLGCGGGDILKDMARWCREKKKTVHFIGIDANENIVTYARRNTSKFHEISYQSINIFSQQFTRQQFDIIHCCLFVHHFSHQDLVRLFRQFKKQASLGVIINDLHRHPLAYQSISMLTRLFSRSEMVKNDAAVSVARGFKARELKDILAEAGIEKYELQWKWAFRWKLVF